MFRFLLVFLCFFALNVNSVSAFMPSYPDDEEYMKCVRITGDYDNCAADEMKRNLNIVKRQYATIAANPNLMEWHKDIADNTATLRDMFESWSAFRVRYCSLSKKAAQYLEKMIDEKISCNSYYISHHKDHLNSILLLLTGNVPSKRSNFEYLNIYDHDDEYDGCIKENNKEKCLSEELKRSTKQIKNLYKTFLEDEFVGKWNNGPDLKNGNYRDLYDSWIAYRNRMCSLSVWAYAKGYKGQGATLNHCLQFFNREMLETMQNILISAHSILDEEIAENINDDGGEAEGKTIKPLERRFDTLQNKEDILEIKETSETSVKPKESQALTPQSKKDLPVWAQ